VAPPTTVSGSLVNEADAFQMLSPNSGWMLGLVVSADHQVASHIFHYQIGKWTEVTNTPFGVTRNLYNMVATAPDDVWIWGAAALPHMPNQSQNVMAHGHA